MKANGLAAHKAVISLDETNVPDVVPIMVQGAANRRRQMLRRLKTRQNPDAYPERPGHRAESLVDSLLENKPAADDPVVSTAIRDAQTGEIWHGEPTHGLLHDKIPGFSERKLEVGFMTKAGQFLTVAETEAKTGMASGEELFLMTPKERANWNAFQEKVMKHQPESVQSAEQLVNSLIESDDVDWHEPLPPDHPIHNIEPTPTGPRRRVFLRPDPAQRFWIQAVELEDGGCVHKILGTFRSPSDFRKTYPDCEIIRNYTGMDDY